MEYSDKNIFINCPFDEEHRDLQNSMVFAALYFDFIPILANMSSDSGEVRLNKIIDMILSCKYSIHDISRLKSKRKGEFHRLNMPLELGIDIGIRQVSIKHQKKEFLIFEAEKYDYQKAASDLSGLDVAPHKNSPEMCIEEIRDWLSSKSSKSLDGGKKVYGQYLEFTGDYFTFLTEIKGHSDAKAEKCSTPDTIKGMKAWIRDNSFKSLA